MDPHLKFRAALFVLASVLAAGLHALPVSADAAPDNLSTCRDRRALPGAVIAACSSLLDSHDLTATGRSAILTRRAQAFEKMGELVRARADLDHAIEIRIDNSVALYERANLRNASHDLAGAIADYGRALDSAGPMSFLYLDRGQARQANGDLDGAALDFGEAARLDPAHPFGFHDRGRVYWLEGKLDAAIADFDAAIKIDATEKETFLDRGIAHQRKGDLSLAIADFSQAIKLGPRWERGYEERGFALAVAYENKVAPFAETDTLDKAIADYDHVVSLGRASARTFTLRGTALSDRNDFTLAIQDFDRSLAIDATFDRAKLARNYAKEELREQNHSLNVADSLLRFQPRNLDLLLTRADLLIHLGSRGEALSVLNKIIEIDPRNTKALGLLAHLSASVEPRKANAEPQRSK